MIDRFGMDTITLAGSLEEKLSAIRAAGFSQVMLNARDVVGHPQGLAAAFEVIKGSGLRVSGLKVLRDFEGLSGHLHAYKVGIAKAMLEMCAALGSHVLVVSSSTSTHATGDRDLLARDLRKLAMLAVPLGIRIAYEALSWGREVREFTAAWDVVSRAGCPNLGIGLDSFHILAGKTSLEALEELDPSFIFLVQLSDFMWNEEPTFADGMATARSFRVFPGEGVNSEQLTDMVLRLRDIGYRGDYSFEVFNSDYQQLPVPFVVERGRRSALWLAEDVLHLARPLGGLTSRPLAQ